MDFLDFSSSGRRWRTRLTDRFDLAIALEFDGPQPRFFAAHPASAQPLQVGRFSGAVTAGASCNCSMHTLSPHCHGTHTECVGHVTGDRTVLTEMTPVAPRLALLATVAPEALGDSGDTGAATATATDPVLTRRLLAAVAAAAGDVPWTALVIRTLPNGLDKQHRVYTGPCPAPYFTSEAMRWVVERGVGSLVVDLPSLDRADDGGELMAHRIYWGLPRLGTDSRQAQRRTALVTELAYVPDTAPDGVYLLDLQVPAFVADAAPSRPVLYPATELPP